MTKFEELQEIEMRAFYKSIRQGTAEAKAEHEEAKKNLIEYARQHGIG